MFLTELKWLSYKIQPDMIVIEAVLAQHWWLTSNIQDVILRHGLNII